MCNINEVVKVNPALSSVWLPDSIYLPTIKYYIIYREVIHFLMVLNSYDKYEEIYFLIKIKFLNKLN